MTHGIKLSAWATIIVAGAFLVLNAFAADKTAEAFVNGIYSHYIGKNAKGVMIDTHKQLEKYFEPSLVSLIEKDEAAAKKNDEVPALDGDPFIDAQDWEIKSFDIKVEHQGADKAAATVKFKNTGEAKLIHVNLVHLKDGWRISDIVWNGDEGTLRGLYTKSAGPTH
jgi:Protein of unknown function (DUF3828)